MAGTLTVQNIEGPSSGANANTILIPSGQELHAPGHVIQIVSGAPAAGISFSSTAETNILTVNITPKFNTSKILVLANFGLYMNSSAAQVRGDFIIRRDSTLIRGRDDGSGVGHFRDGSGHFKSYMTGFNHLDSPATTSQITYKMAYKGHTYDVGGDYNEDYTNMTLMEIAQ